MTLQRALLLLVLMMGLAFVYACGDDDDGETPEPDASVDSGPIDPCADVICDEVDAGSAALMWSCRATSFGNPMCMDFPQDTYSKEDATASCQASVDQGGGTLDELVEDSNCAVDQIATTWRCEGTKDTAGDVVPLYYAYAEGLPIGICAANLAGTVVDRPADCCWKDYD